MRFRPVTLALAGLALILTPVCCLRACSPQKIISGNKLTKNSPRPGAPLPDSSVPLKVPDSFRSAKEIITYFADQGVPTETKELPPPPRNYFFLLAYPYSGADTADLYCFVRRDQGWRRFFTTALPNTSRGPVDFKLNGHQINVLLNGAVVM